MKELCEFQNYIRRCYKVKFLLFNETKACRENVPAFEKRVFLLSRLSKKYRGKHVQTTLSLLFLNTGNNQTERQALEALDNLDKNVYEKISEEQKNNNSLKTVDSICKFKLTNHAFSGSLKFSLNLNFLLLLFMGKTSSLRIRRVCEKFILYIIYTTHIYFCSSFCRKPQRFISIFSNKLK